MGGRGKTPLVAAIVRRLLAAGERPAILSRGYGRVEREPGVIVVSDGTHLLADVDRAGDEPIMLAHALPGAIVLVCDQRAIARALAERALGATVHVLDDGFQHRAFARDIDIVSIAARDLDDRRLPFGRLRSPVSSLERADAVVVESHEADAPLLERLRQLISASCRVFPMLRRLGAPMTLDGAGPIPPGERVVALTAIAGPDRFVNMAMDAGYDVARVFAFRDHHRFSRADFDRAARAARADKAAGILTTEKDAMRLLPLRPFGVAVTALPLDVAIGSSRIGGGEAFDDWLLARLEVARQRARRLAEGA
jgi:tetraacyldisaccharide 4'-kinase